MKGELNLKEEQREWHGSLRSYLIGGIGSILFTATAFLMTAQKWWRGPALTILLVLLALGQAVLQLRYFLHLGKESKPRWELLTFYFMVMVLLIIALGSLWIMYDLHDRLMSNMSMGEMHD